MLASDLAPSGSVTGSVMLGVPLLMPTTTLADEAHFHLVVFGLDVTHFQFFFSQSDHIL